MCYRYESFSSTVILWFPSQTNKSDSKKTLPVYQWSITKALLIVLRSLICFISENTGGPIKLFWSTWTLPVSSMTTTEDPEVVLSAALMNSYRIMCLCSGYVLFNLSCVLDKTRCYTQQFMPVQTTSWRCFFLLITYLDRPSLHQLYDVNLNDTQHWNF